MSDGEVEVCDGAVNPCPDRRRPTLERQMVPLVDGEGSELGWSGAGRSD